MYYSETQFYKEVKRKPVLDHMTGKSVVKVQLENQKGENIVVDESYLDTINSHDRVLTEESVTQTDLINIILANPKTVMSVYFQTKEEKKLVKEYKAEKEAKIEQIKTAKVSEIGSLLSDLIDNPILPTKPGKMRLMKGYHFGKVDERGRIEFKDMEEVNKDVLKTVDPRTTEFVIVNNVKYIKKR